jgi:hypothetical protein
MEGHQGIPVKPPPNACGVKVRGCLYLVRIVSREDLKLQDAGTGQFHFQQQRKLALRLQSNHTPGTDHIVDSKLFRMTPFTAKAGAANDPVGGVTQSLLPYWKKVATRSGANINN